MRKLVFVLSVAFCLSVISFAYAEPSQYIQVAQKDSSITQSIESGPQGTGAAVKTKDWTFVLGYRGWYNSWQTGTIYRGNASATGSVATETTSGYEFTSIPFASIKFKDFFISGSYFTETKYTFPSWSTYENYPATVGTILVQTDLSAKRDEWDVNLGYMILGSPIGVTVGWKEINQKYTSTQSSPGIVFTPATSDSKTEIKGPTIGLNGNYGLGAGFYFYGAFAYGWFDVYYDGTKTDKAEYTLFDMGVGYRPPKLPLASFSIGYRLQDIHTKFDAQAAGDFSNKGTDITKGVVFAFNLIF